METTITRPFYPDEKRILNRLLKEKETEANAKKKYYYFPIALVIGIGSAWAAANREDGFLLLAFGTLAVLAFGFVIFMPYELYKDARKQKYSLEALKDLINKGTVTVYPVNATRIAFAPEYEDESDLYIVETDEKKILYIWDFEYNLNRKLPCTNFEIYIGPYFELTGRLVHALSKKTLPVVIDKKAKWNYLHKYGVPEHLQTEAIPFDVFIERINCCI